MDQIVKALGLINSFRMDGLHGSANPTSGARLNLAGGLEKLELTAADGELEGLKITSQGFGVANLSLPTSQNPSISLDPYLSHLSVDLEKELFGRLAVFAGDPMLADMHQVVNRVVVRRLHTVVRMSAQKVVHLDVVMDQVLLQHDEEELIRIKDLSLSVLDFNTKLPPKQALEACQVVLRKLRVEIEERFFALVLEASRAKIPKEVTNLVIELPGPHMIVGAHVKKGILKTNTRADLELETEADLFGINIKRLYVPGTNLKVPDWIRDSLLGAVRKVAERKLRGVVEVSNHSIRINPWTKIPLDIMTHVAEFAVTEQKIVVVFTEPSDRTVPAQADEYARATGRELRPGDLEHVLAPGPAL